VIHIPTGDPDHFQTHSPLYSNNLLSPPFRSAPQNFLPHPIIQGTWEDLEYIHTARDSFTCKPFPSFLSSDPTSKSGHNEFLCTKDPPSCRIIPSTPTIVFSSVFFVVDPFGVCFCNHLSNIQACSSTGLNSLLKFIKCNFWSR
jgi:hypothetical protein